MCDGNQEIIFTSSEPSLAVVYDRKTGLHSVYKIRKATTDECQSVGGSMDAPNSVYNISVASPLNIRNSSSAGKNSPKDHMSIFGKYTQHLKNKSSNLKNNLHQ